MISDKLKKLARFAWLLPGFLLWAAFPPMGEKTDILFALAPLLWLSRQGDVKRSVQVWALNGLVFWCATLSWMPAIVKNGGPWPLVVLGWAGLAAYCAAYFAAFGWLSAAFWRWAREKSAADCPALAAAGLRLLGVLFVEPVLWCGLELVRSRFLGGFAWNHLGVVPANAGFGAPAALGGVYLLSAVVLLINGTVAGIAERMVSSVRRQRVDRWRSLETLLAFGLVWGVYRLASGLTPVRESEAALKVALIQRNFPCVFQTNAENPYETYARLLEHVSALKPDLIVLPESALCEIGTIGRSGAQGFADWVKKETGAAVLAGGTRVDEKGTYNSAALYGEGPLQVYDKSHLVPFGEYIPGDKLIPALQKLAPVGSCTPGELKLLEIGGKSLGVAICFEDTDSAQVRELAAMGAQALVFVTNDSWFSYSNESVQHAWQAVARAIETGLPVIRVGNSGVTGVVWTDGRTNWLLDAQGRRPLTDRSGTMFDRIPLAAKPLVRTPYVVLGDAPLALAFLAILLTAALFRLRAWRRHRIAFQSVLCDNTTH